MNTSDTPPTPPAGDETSASVDTSSVNEAAAVYDESTPSSSTTELEPAYAASLQLAQDHDGGDDDDDDAQSEDKMPTSTDEVEDMISMEEEVSTVVDDTTPPADEDADETKPAAPVESELKLLPPPSPAEHTKPPTKKPATTKQTFSIDGEFALSILHVSNINGILTSGNDNKNNNNGDHRRTVSESNSLNNSDWVASGSLAHRRYYSESNSGAASTRVGAVASYGDDSAKMKKEGEDGNDSNSNGGNSGGINREGRRTSFGTFLSSTQRCNALNLTGKRSSQRWSHGGRYNETE